MGGAVAFESGLSQASHIPAAIWREALEISGVSGREEASPAARYLEPVFENRGWGWGS